MLCHCMEDQLCHGDILIDLLNNRHAYVEDLDEDGEGVPRETHDRRKEADDDGFEMEDDILESELKGEASKIIFMSVSHERNYVIYQNAEKWIEIIDIEKKMVVRSWQEEDQVTLIEWRHDEY